MKARTPIPCGRTVALLVGTLSAGTGWHDDIVRAQDVGTSIARLAGGQSSPDTPIANTTVWVNGGSGTLVAPNLVLTNGHVANVTPPLENPPFSVTDVAYPDRWYPLPQGNVLVAVTSARFGAFGVGADGRDILSSRTRLTITFPAAGTLQSGAVVGLKTSNNRYLYVMDGRITGTVEVDQLYNRFDAWQEIRVDKVSGSDAEIRTGDRVVLRARDGSYIASIGGRPNPRLQADSFTRAERHEFVIWRRAGPGAVRQGDEVGLLASRAGGGGWLQYPLLYDGIQVSVPGLDDLALIRLDADVPSDAAVVSRLMAYLPPGVSSPAAFYEGKRLRAVGFGIGAPTAQRQQADFVDVRQVFNQPEVFIGSGVNGAGIRSGDSGGSWFWDTGSPRTTWLVGVTWQWLPAAGHFITTLAEGGGSAALSKPDLTAWYGLHLQLDNCRAVTVEDRRSNRAFDQTGASEVCSFGGTTRYAVALFGGSSDGADCVAFNRDNLTLERPHRVSGQWRLQDGAHSMLRIPGTWQQSYTRGAYLIDFARRRGLSKMCFVDRPSPSLVYFRP